MTEDSRPRLDWNDGEAEEEPGENRSQDGSSDSESSEGLCKVEDPTCEACQ